MSSFHILELTIDLKKYYIKSASASFVNQLGYKSGIDVMYHAAATNMASMMFRRIQERQLLPVV